MECLVKNAIYEFRYRVKYNNRKLYVNELSVERKCIRQATSDWYDENNVYA